MGRSLHRCPAEGLSWRRRGRGHELENIRIFEKLVGTIGPPQFRVPAVRSRAVFLSAVADRFGWWGAFGQPNVSWGNFARLVEYTGKLNWFSPHAMIPALAVIATCESC